MNNDVEKSIIIELDGYKTLSENQLVEFKLIETSKGYQAINVQLVKEQTTAAM